MALMALFVNKQLFWWSSSITLDNNKPLARFLTLYFTFLSWPDRLYFYSFFSFENIDSFDHYPACYVTLTL